MSARDILQPRKSPDAGLELGGIAVELVGIRALQGELVKALGHPSADLDRRRVLEEDIDAGNPLTWGRSCSMIWSTLVFRSLRGLVRTNMRPALLALTRPGWKRRRPRPGAG